MVLAQREPFTLLRARVPLPTECWSVSPSASQPAPGRAGGDKQIGTLRQTRGLQKLQAGTHHRNQAAKEVR